MPLLAEKPALPNRYLMEQTKGPESRPLLSLTLASQDPYPWRNRRLLQLQTRGGKSRRQRVDGWGRLGQRPIKLPAGLTIVAGHWRQARQQERQ